MSHVHLYIFLFPLTVEEVLCPGNQMQGLLGIPCKFGPAGQEVSVVAVVDRPFSSKSSSIICGFTAWAIANLEQAFADITMFVLCWRCSTRKSESERFLVLNKAKINYLKRGKARQFI